MRCEEWERLCADEEADKEAEQHVRECERCRALAEEMAANLEALRSMREDVLLPVAVRVRRRRFRVPAAVAAALVLLTLAGVVGGLRVSRPEAPGRSPAAAQKGWPHEQTLMVKMYTPDPNVVIYWLIESKPGESE